jgi:hypothetical protein
MYLASVEPSPPLAGTELGPVYATVTFKVADHVCDPNYRPRDGDAAYLEVGTDLYAIRGQPPAQAIAARHDGRLWVYRAQP